jgi:glycerophosphoryl diester phosphodiesterase
VTLVVGHRGACAYRPENTLPSYELAIEQGVDAIELDVHLTADGQLAVIHDDTVERTTDGTGPVVARTMDELRALDAGAGFEASDGTRPYRGQGLRIPTLAEVLDWLPEGKGLVVEIKARAAVDATVEALRGSRVAAAGGASIISFDEASIERAHELAPEIPTGYLLVPFDSFDRGLEYAVARGHLGIHPWEGDLGLDPMPFVAKAEALGRQVGCYVVNERGRMQHLAACGLWGFVTDMPDVAREALQPGADRGY